MDNKDKKNLRLQLETVAEWALDIAIKIAGDDADDHDAIENVRAFVLDWFAGHRAEVPVSDLLRTIAILMSAIELDIGLEAVSLLAPLYTMFTTPEHLPTVLRCPGAPHQSARRRRFPGTTAPFTRVAA
jgi:hypothetical protein|nr:hypothetical protein [Kofleriaceae bacterium]